MWNKGTVSIGVGGSKSGIGKTTLIERLIIKLKEREHKIIAIKFTKTSSDYSIVDDDQIILKEGKDTERLKKAGAEKVLWVRSSEENLLEIVALIKDKLSSLIEENKNSFLIIEGNSLVKVMEPDVIIFLKEKNSDVLKPSGQELLKLAHIIIEDNYSMEEIMEQIERELIKREIEKKLRENSKDGKITCAQARGIAEELNVPYIEVGRAANELKIKIRKCELGCF